MINILLFLAVGVMVFFDYKRSQKKYKLLLLLPVLFGMFLMTPLATSIPAGFVWIGRWVMLFGFVAFVYCYYRDMKSQR